MFDMGHSDNSATMRSGLDLALLDSFVALKKHLSMFSVSLLAHLMESDQQDETSEARWRVG